MSKCEGCGTEGPGHASNCPIRYGVPTGYAARLARFAAAKPAGRLPNGTVTAEPYPTTTELRTEPLTRLIHDAPIQKAVDDYLLMERKARAWDLLLTQYAPAHPSLLHLMIDMVHPAQSSAPADR